MTARENLRAILWAKGPHGSHSPQRSSWVTGLIEAHRTEVLNEAADELVAFCPDHGSRDTSFMNCHCPAADDLRRKAKTEAGAA